MRWTTRKLAGAGLAAAVVAYAGAAVAADAPQVGPVPAWARPAPTVAAEKDDAKALPMAVLLNDTQLSLDAAGWTEFHRFRVRAQSPEGLQALGTFPFQWSPWSDTLTFHSAAILRDGQTIDVLPKDGGFTVLRRETGLEQAMLTGVLTALLQPDGLQVGDVLEVAVSIHHADPLLKGRIGAMLANWDLAPVGRVRLEAHWPSSLPVRWRETAGLAPLRRTEAGGVTTVSLDLEDVRPPVLPAHAPQRFQHGRQVEFTTFADWTDVAAVMAPLFAKAAVLAPGSAVAEQARLIAKASPDPKARAAAALRLVQAQVRYLAHAEAGGGYTPQTADDTWRLRYGDCKAKTVLLIALLHELGIQAEPALASLANGDGLDARLPSATLFDHVLVRARVDGRDYWLDGARQGDRDLDEAPTPAYGWVLPLDSAGAGLVRLKPAPGVRPQVLQVIRYDASGGVTKDEPTELETTLRGDAGVVAHAQMSAVPQDRLEASLKAYWAQLHTAFTPTHVAAAWDPATGEEKLTAEGTSKLDWSGAGLELHHVEFGGALDIKRDPAASDPDAPYSVDFPSFTETDESVVLPPGDDLPPDSAKATDVDTVIGGVAYRRTGVLSGHTLKVTLISKALQPEITAAEARASVTPLTTLGQQGVYAPAGSQSQAANDAANIDSHPSTADGHFDRAAALLDAGRYPEAVAEFDAAIALDPKSQKAWSGRALAHAALLDPAAITDADKADTLGPPQTFSASARGTLAFNTGDMAGARIAFRQVMVLDPKDDSTLTQLLSLDLQAGDPDAADRDLEALKQAKPDTALRYHLWKARIAEARGNKDAARQELAQAPGDTADTLIERSKVYFGLGDLDRARADADAAIHMKPSVQAWSARANADGGYASPKAAPDLDAAIKLAPNDQEVILWQVSAAMMRRDFATALEQIDRLIVVNRGARGEMLTRRAQIEVRLGQDADADSDFSSGRTATGADAAAFGRVCAAEVWARWRPETALADCERDLQRGPRSIGLLLDRALLLHRLKRDPEADKALDAVQAQLHTAGEMNGICYSIATEGFALDRALALCDASLKLKPNVSATLDSRAFVLLRLGRDAEALEGYNAALTVQPKEYNSLYGRGLVEARLGRAAASATDLHAALKARPDLRADFEEMGVE